MRSRIERVGLRWLAAALLLAGCGDDSGSTGNDEPATASEGVSASKGSARSSGEEPPGGQVPARPPAPPWPEGCVDRDRDHWPTCDGISTPFQQDCDDMRRETRPAADELCDERDNDCDGAIDEALDECPPPRPDQEAERARRNASVRPSPRPAPPAKPWPGGCVDHDTDLWPACPGVETDFVQDCDDDAIETRPGADELCDNTDNNCDGVIDEGIAGCPNNPDNPPLDEGGGR